MADPACDFVEKHLPKSLRFLISRYTKEASSESETGKLWRSVLSRYVWRIILYSIVLVAVTLISLNWVLPWLTEYSSGWGRFICTVATLVAMGPFLVALCYPASKRTERQRLVQANAHFDVPLIVMTIFRMLISLMFVIYFLGRVYSLTIGILVGISVFILILLTLSKRLHSRLGRLESRFFDNLNERELRRSGRNNILISNIHQAFMTVGYGCPFVGERLQDSDLRRKYGVSISSIFRGGERIPVPGGETRIFPGDVLGVIGTDEQIQAILPLVEAQTDTNDADGDGYDFRLMNIQLSPNSPIAGKTVAASGLRNRYQTLLVSMARDGEFITPEASTVLEPHDILWLVGKPKTITSLK